MTNVNEDFTDGMIALVLGDLYKLFDRLPEEAYKAGIIVAILDWISLDSIGSVGKRGFYYHPLRVALTGKESSPPPQDIIPIIGKGETLKRIKIAFNKINPVQ